MGAAHSVATPTLLDTLALSPGERLLDVGCGLGAATLRAAQVVGPDGAVTGVDISAPIIERAATQAARSDVTRLSFHAADAQTDSIAGGPFTAAMSQFGVMFFDDPVAAFTNTRRHLTADGLLCFTCWQIAERNPWSFAEALAHLLPQSPGAAVGEPAPGPFSLADPRRVRRLLHEAGVGRVQVTRHRTEVDVGEGRVVDDAELVLMGVPADRIPEARARFANRLARYRSGSGMLRLPLAFLTVAAR